MAPLSAVFCDEGFVGLIYVKVSHCFTCQSYSHQTKEEGGELTAQTKVPPQVPISV